MDDYRYFDPHGTLHLILICDYSSSMATDDKIQAINNTIRELLPVMREAADENPALQVRVRVLKFSSGAEWINKDPVPVEDFKWLDLDLSSTDRDIGKALSMVADVMKIPPMPAKRGFCPVFILIADGPPTDDFESGLKMLLDQPWGRKAVRISIKIGNFSNDNFLQKFIGNSEIKPLTPKNAESFVKQIRWLSTTVDPLPVSDDTVW